MIKIKSISDVITNSSSEVFIIKVGKIFEFFKKKLKEENISIESVLVAIFKTEEDIKKFFLENNSDIGWFWDDYHFKNYTYNGISIMPFIDFFNSNYNENNIINYMRKIKGYSNDQIWDFIKDSYKPCIGYAYFGYDTDCVSENFYMKLDKCYHDTLEYQNICENGYKPGNKNIPVNVEYSYYDDKKNIFIKTSVELKAHITEDWKIEVNLIDQPGVPDILKEDEKSIVNSIKFKKKIDENFNKILD